MKRLLFVVSAALIAFAGMIIAGSASAQGPGPTAGTVLVSGLVQPKGIVLGPDGMLYVAESGNGGPTESELTQDGQTVKVKNGYTGRISKINPSTGARTTVADGLASQGNINDQGEVEAVGPTDVAFIGDNLYYLQTHAGDAWGFPDFETGIYRVQNNGDVVLVADIGAYNIANPTQAISDGSQQDIEIGGNPYSMDVYNGAFYVIDGNHNRMTKVTTGGVITSITEFPNHSVSTGIDFASDGTAYVSLLGQGPFAPEDGKVVKVNLSTGAISPVAAGASMPTDVEFGPGGQLYALQFNDTTAGDFPAFGPFSGSIRKVNADGTLPVVVGGLSFASGLEFDGNTAYVTNFGVTDDGQVVKIPNFSSVQPPPAPTVAPPAASPTTAPAAPTATPRAGGVIVAPNTGSGSSAGSGWQMPILLLAIAAAGGAFAVAGVVARRRA